MIKANIITFVFSLLILPIFSQEDLKHFTNFDQNQELVLDCNLDDYGSIYRISKAFNQSIDEIISYNQIKDVGSLKSGQIIKVKLDKSKISHKKSPGALALYYKVKEGETLYRISRTYLNQDINQFIELNELPNHTLHKDAILLIGYLNITNTSLTNPAQIASLEVTDSINKVNIPSPSYIRQKGIAYVNGTKGYYVLHSDAKIHSEVEIYNPMARRTTKAKVIGKIPEGTYNPDINVVLSKATARSLGALDARFMVEIRYIQN